MRLWEQYQNWRWRRSLRQALAAEAAASVAPVGSGSGWEARTWAVVEGRLPPRRSHAPQRPWILVALPLATAAVAATLWLGKQDTSVGRSSSPAGTAAPTFATGDFGSKGNNLTIATLAALRFAMLAPNAAADTKLVPGRSGMRIPIGTRLIFQVESTGVSPENPLAVELVYQHDGRTSVISRYALTRPRETLHRDDASLALTLATAGPYTFVLRPVAPTADGGDQNNVGFTVQVVP